MLPRRNSLHYYRYEQMKVKYIFAVLGFELIALHLLGKLSST
jgi:hypothetical protein